MDAGYNVTYETSEAIYEVYMTVTVKSVSDPAKQTGKNACRPLADRILAEHGSYETARETLEQMALILKLESRMGSLRHKYPFLEDHEIVALIYDRVMGV